MNKIMYKYFIVSTTVLSVLFLGCQREQMTLIKGRWNKIIMDPNVTYEEIWSFENNDVYRIYYNLNTGNTDTISIGTYSIKNNTLSIVGEIYPFDTPWFKGDFAIDRLDEEVLIIYRKEDGSGVEYQEFVKE